MDTIPNGKAGRPPDATPKGDAARAAPPGPGKAPVTLLYLIRNLISFMGLFGMTCFGLGLLVSIALDLTGFFKSEGAYTGLVTYVLLPALFTASAAFTILGMLLKWRRTRRYGVQVGLVPGRTPARRAAAVGTAAVVTAAWLLLSVFGSYKAYQYTDSTAFCGLACHKVMEPEYTAYRQSVHARVNCVECHIGPGADWFVKSKITGLRQLWAYARETYKTPIRTPLHSLRPAQDTCEHCHWPGRFSGSVERVITHYSTDNENTPARYVLLMKVGGGHEERGQPSGAHWHVSADWTVQYLARDEKRQDIPYVRVVYKDGRIEEFMAPGFERAALAGDMLRTMDCLDCHTRPSHVFKSPDRALDEAMDRGLISPSLPGIKKVAKNAISAPYRTKEEALAAIDAALDAYAKEHPRATDPPGPLDSAREQIKRVYAVNFFPEHGVDYRAFLDNLGHFEFRGCERCHDGKHAAAGGTQSISKKCDNCHAFLAQANGVKEVANMKYEVRDFEHPDEPVNLKKTCSSCHALDKDGK